MRISSSFDPVYHRNLLVISKSRAAISLVPELQSPKCRMKSRRLSDGTPARQRNLLQVDRLSKEFNLLPAFHGGGVILGGIGNKNE